MYECCFTAICSRLYLFSHYWTFLLLYPPSLLPLNKGCFLLMVKYFVLSVWQRIHMKTSGNKQQVIRNQQHFILYPLHTHTMEIKIVDSLSTCQWMKWSLYLACCRKCRLKYERLNASGCGHFTLIIKINTSAPNFLYMYIPFWVIWNRTAVEAETHFHNLHKFNISLFSQVIIYYLLQLTPL
jgi:hypothetical protein